MARQEGLPWAGGSSALPPFASPANRALASQIDAMQTELDSVLALIREQTTREGRMTAYTERVRSENAEARKLVDARKTDVQVETERTREANMDGKRLERELYDLSQEIRQTEAQISSFKTAVASGNNRSSRLEAAAIATLSELDDELQLQRLREEQDRVNEQEAQRIPKEAEAKVRRLERIENEIAMLEGRCLEEESTSQTLRNSLAVLSSRLSNLQSHKSALVEQWQSHLSALTTVSSLVEAAGTRLDEADATLREKHAEVTKAEQRLQRDIAVLEKVDRPRVSGKERELQQVRGKLATVLRLVSNQKSELQVLTSAMERGNQKLDELKELNSKRRKGLNELEYHVIPSLEDKVAGLEKDIETEEQKRKEEERVIEGLEELVDNEQARLNELETDLDAVKTQQRQKLTEAENLKQSERRLLSEVTSTESAIQKVEKQIAAVRLEMDSQERSAYSHEFACVEMRRTIRKLKGLDALNADLEQLQGKINELSVELDDDTTRLVRIRDECQSVSSQVARQQTRLSEASADLENSQSKSKQVELDVGSLSRELAQKSRERENLLVELALLKLQLKRLSERKNLKEIDLGNFEERMAGEQAAFEDRKSELEAELHRLRTAIAKSEDAKSETQRLVASERVVLEKLRKRWELLAGKLQGLRERADPGASSSSRSSNTSGETETPSTEDLSAESDRIKKALADQIAKQRDDLSSTLFNLRSQITEVENQIARLQVTLSDTLASTSEWKRQMEMRGVSAKTIETKEALEAQLQDSLSFLESRRAHLAQIESELLEMEAKIADAEQKQADIDADIAIEQAQLDKLAKETREGAMKVDRAKSQIAKIDEPTKSALGLKLLKDAKRDLADKVLRLMGDKQGEIDPHLVAEWTDRLKSSGIAVPDLSPVMNGISKKKSPSKPRAATPFRPTTPPIVRFPSHESQLARSTSSLPTNSQHKPSFPTQQLDSNNKPSSLKTSRLASRTHRDM